MKLVFSSFRVFMLNFILATFIFASCGDQQQKHAYHAVKFPSPSETYKRDSLFLAFTVREFIDKQVDIFDFYKKYKIPQDEIGVDVDSIFYSPDSLKLFSFIIMSVPNYQHGKPTITYYDGEDMIGFRTSKKNPWTIYYFGQIRPSGIDNYNKVREIFRRYYLGGGKFKDDYASYWDGKRNDTLQMARAITFPNEDNRINIKFRYNIDDKYFWDSSIVWKKGSRIPGFYSFQTKGNVAPGYRDDPIIAIPSLNYPDSLLNLYK